MSVADLVLVRTQLLEKLLASPRAISQRYTDAIGRNSEYPKLKELTDTILIYDQAICMLIVSAPKGHPYASLFMALSPALSNGGKIADHVGSYGDVLVAIDGVYLPSVSAKSREEILRMIDNEDLYGGPSRHHFIENNFVYHSGTQADPSVRVNFPIFNKKANACQSPDAYTDVLISGAIQGLEKQDSDPAYFGKHTNIWMAGREMIKSGAEFIPTEALLGARVPAGAATAAP